MTCAVDEIKGAMCSLSRYLPMIYRLLLPVIPS